MLYCTKCKSICEDSTQTCPNCKRSRGLRPVKPEDEVFFLKVSEGEAAELALLFEQNAVRHAIHPVKGGFSTSVYDPEYLPTDKDIYVEYQDLERAKELMLKEREEQSQEKPSEEDDMPRRQAYAHPVAFRHRVHGNRHFGRARLGFHRKSLKSAFHKVSTAAKIGYY